MKRGFVYACSNDAWLPETVKSASSCRKQMPDVPLQLFVTSELNKSQRFDLSRFFDNVVTVDIPRHEHRPRFDAALKTDLDQAIFVDGDTLFLSPIYEVFEILDYFDIAATLAPQAFTEKGIRLAIYDDMPKVSSAQAEWNTGLIAARVDQQFRAFIESWSQLFSKTLAKGVEWDQASFRVALATSRLRVAALPENYNFRANIPRFANGPVKLLHAHGDLEAIAKYVNSNLQMRVYIPNKTQIYGSKPKRHQ